MQKRTVYTKLNAVRVFFSHIKPDLNSFVFTQASGLKLIS